MQGRELKYFTSPSFSIRFTTPLMQGRELKYTRCTKTTLPRHAPHAGAGIEIRTVCELKIPRRTPLMQGRELKFHTAVFGAIL